MVKLKLTDFNNLKNKKFTSLDGILFYGPDRGQVLENFDATIKEIVGEHSDGFSLFEINPYDIKNNPSKLFDEASSISFLKTRTVIKIKDAGDEVVNVIKDLLAKYEKLESFLVLSAGELSPSSKLRILFETNKRLAILPNYLDDNENLTKLIKQALINAGIKRISDEILLFLRNKLGEDRSTTKMELEKLSLYLYGKNEITIDDVRNCIMDSSSINLYDLPIIVAEGNVKRLSKVLPRLLSEGYSPVQLLKLVLNHFKNLLIMVSEKDNGKSISEIITGARPPIFYKLKPSYEKQIKFWTTDSIMKVIIEVNKTDIKLKTMFLSQDVLLSQLLFSITSLVV